MLVHCLNSVDMALGKSPQLNCDKAVPPKLVPMKFANEFLVEFKYVSNGRIRA
jgi:hypothetical protein